jgi:hypothetical protein
MSGSVGESAKNIGFAQAAHDGVPTSDVYLCDLNPIREKILSVSADSASTRHGGVSADETAVSPICRHVEAEGYLQPAYPRGWGKTRLLMPPAAISGIQRIATQRLRGADAAFRVVQINTEAARPGVRLPANGLVEVRFTPICLHVGSRGCTLGA